jgi:hypothetical protein
MNKYTCFINQGAIFSKATPKFTRYDIFTFLFYTLSFPIHTYTNLNIGEFLILQGIFLKETT